MSPSEPATGGALVDVHVLQVHVHAKDAAAEDRGEEEKTHGFKQAMKELRGFHHLASVEATKLRGGGEGERGGEREKMYIQLK